MDYISNKNTNIDNNDIKLIQQQEAENNAVIYDANTNTSLLALNALASDDLKQRIADKFTLTKERLDAKAKQLNPEQEVEILDVLDADTMKVRMPNGSEQIVRDSTLSGYYYDSVDKQGAVENSSFKRNIQPEFVAKTTGKKVTELTPFDYENVSNWQRQNKVFALTQGLDENTLNPLQSYNPNQVYNPLDTDITNKGVKAKIRIQGKDGYGRLLANIENAYTGNLVTEELSSRVNQNATLNLQQLYDRNEKYLNYQIENNRDLTVEPDFLNKLSNLGATAIKKSGVRLFASARNIFEQIDMPFGMQAIDSIYTNLANMDKLLNKVGLTEGRLQNYDLKDLDKATSEEREQILNKLANLDNNYTNYINNILNKSNEYWKDGKYLQSIAEGIFAVPNLLADSSLDIALGAIAGSVTGGIAGTITGAGAGLAKRIAVKIAIASTPAVAMSITQFGEALQTYEENNGHSMSADKAALLFGGLAITNLVDFALLKHGAKGILNKTALSNMYNAIKHTTDKVTRNKLLSITARYPILFASGGIAESAQEYTQTVFTESMTQREEDAKTLLEIATNSDSTFAAMLGGLAGGSIAVSMGTARDVAQLTKAGVDKTKAGINKAKSNINKAKHIIQDKLPDPLNKPIKKANQTQEEFADTIVRRQSLFTELDSISKEVEKEDLTVNELNELINRGQKVRNELLSNDQVLTKDLISKAHILGTKVALKQAILLKDDVSAEKILNSKEFNPTGIQDKELLLRKLYYYSDKNNKAQQDIIEKLADKLQVNPDVFKKADAVEEEAVFGSKGYITYGLLLKSYNEQLQDKNLDKRVKKEIEQRKEIVEDNLAYFADTQIKKLERISQAIQKLVNNVTATKVEFVQPKYDNNTREVGYVYRNNIVYGDEKEGKGIFITINGATRNIQGIINQLETYESIIDTNDIRKRANTELKNIIKYINILREKANRPLIKTDTIDTKIPKKAKEQESSIKDKEQKLSTREIDEIKEKEVKTKSKEDLVNILTNAFNEDNPTTTVEKSQVRHIFNNNISNSTNTILSKSVGNLLDYMNKVLISIPAVIKVSNKTKKKLYYNLDSRETRVHLEDIMKDLIKEFQSAKTDTEIKNILEDKRFKDIYYTLLKYTRDRFEYYKQDTTLPKSHKDYYKTIYDTVNKTLQDLYTLSSNIEPDSKTVKPNKQIRYTIDKFKKYLKQKEITNEQTTSKTKTEKQIPTENRTDGNKQIQQEMVSKEQDRKERENNKIDAGSTELASNKTLEEKDINIPKEEKVSVEAKSEAKNDIKIEKQITTTENKPILDTSKPITLHSGGADGADTYWGEISKQYGIKANHYRYGDMKKGNKTITKEDAKEGKEKVLIAGKQTGAISKYAKNIHKPELIRNWSQVKHSDTIIAVGHIVSKGEKLFPNQKTDTRTANIIAVAGGTGYAVQMAINEGKPVYVYDQERKQWYKNINGKWSKSEIPIITNNFAGIGTRALNEDSKKAIRDVYEKSFKNSKTNEATKPTGKEALGKRVLESLPTLEKTLKIMYNVANALAKKEYYNYKKLPDNVSKAVQKFYKSTIPEEFKLDGDNKALYDKDGNLITNSYDRIVIGDYGAFIEFTPTDEIKSTYKTKKGEEYRETPQYAKTKYNWKTIGNSNIKIYEQKNTVSYADYKAGKYYVALNEVQFGKDNKIVINNKVLTEDNADDLLVQDYTETNNEEMINETTETITQEDYNAVYEEQAKTTPKEETEVSEDYNPAQDDIVVNDDTTSSETEIIETKTNTLESFNKTPEELNNILKYTNQEIYSQQVALIDKKTIETSATLKEAIQLAVKNKAPISVVVDLNPVVTVSVPQKDENGNFIRNQKGFYVTTDRKVNIELIPYKDKVFKSNNKRVESEEWLIRSIKEKEDFIASEITAFDIFPSLQNEENISKVITKEDLINIQREQITDKVVEKEEQLEQFEEQTKIEKDKLYKEAKDLNEKSEIIKEFYNKLHADLRKYINDIDKSATKEKKNEAKSVYTEKYKEFINSLSKEEKEILANHNIDLKDLNITDLDKFTNLIKPIQNTYKDYQKQSTEVFMKLAAFKKETSKQHKELNKEFKKVMNKYTQEIQYSKQVRTTRTKNTLAAKQINIDNTTGMKNQLAKISTNVNSEGSIFSMLEVDKNHKYVKDVVNTLRKAIRLQLPAKQLDKLTNKETPAYVLLFNQNFNNLDMSSDKNITVKELNNILDYNTVMSIDYAVNKLFSINRKIFTISDETLNSVKNNEFIKLVLGRSKLPTHHLVIDKLGEYAVQALGITYNGDIASNTDWDAIRQSFGLMAYAYAVQKGYIRTKKYADVDITELGKVKVQKAVLVAEDITNEADRELMKLKYDTLTLEAFNDKHGLLTEPNKDKTVKVKDEVAGQETTPLIEAVHEQIRNTKYKVDNDVLNWILDNEELAKYYLGYTSEEDLEKITLVDIRKEKEGKNQTIEYSLEQLKDLAEKGFDSVYFNTYASKNYRNMLDTNSIDPQGNKLHRFIVYTDMEEYTRDLDLNVEKDKILFIYGLAQAFGLDVDNNSDKAKLELFDKLTILDPDEINRRLLKKEDLDFGHIKLEVKELSHFIQGINTLKVYKKQQELGKNIIPKDTPLLYETDASSSVLAYKVLSLCFFEDENVRNLAEKAGIFINKPMTINQFKENKSNTDVYQYSAIKMPNIKKGITEEQLEDIKMFTDMSGKHTKISLQNDVIIKVFDMFKDVLPTVDENKTVSKALRTLFKNPTMTNLYQVGFNTMTATLSKAIMLDLFTKYSEYKVQGMNNDTTKAIEEFFSYIIPKLAFIKGIGMDTIKQIKTNNVKSSTKQQAIKDFLSILKEKSFNEIYLEDGLNLLEFFNNTIGYAYGGLVFSTLAENFSVLRGSTVILGSINGIFHKLMLQQLPLNKLNTLPINEVKRIIKEGSDGQLGFYPSIPVPFSNSEKQGIVSMSFKPVNNLELDGVENTNVSIRLSKTSPSFYVEQFTQDKAKHKDTVISSTNVNFKEYEMSRNSLSAMITHSEDSAVINLLQGLLPNITGVHDAAVQRITNINSASEVYNRALYEVTMNYNPYKEAYNKLKTIVPLFTGKDHTKYIEISKLDYHFIVELFKSSVMQKDYANHIDKSIQALYSTISNTPVNDIKLLSKKAKESLNYPAIYRKGNQIYVHMNTFTRMVGMLAVTTEQHKQRAKASDMYISNMDGTDDSYYSNQYKDNTSVSLASIIKQNAEEYVQDVLEDNPDNPKANKMQRDINVLRYNYETTSEEDKVNRSKRLLTDGNERIALFNELIEDTPFKDVEFSQELRELLGKLSSLRLDNMTVDLLNKLGNFGEFDIENNKITIAASKKAPYSRYTNAGVRYVHEVVHAATSFALENHKELGLSQDLQKLYHLYELASKHITPEDFLPEIIVDEKYDREEANNIYNYIFNNKDKSYPLRGLNEFIAYALTDERIVKKLKTITVDKNQNITKSMWTIIKEIVSNIFKLVVPAKNKTLETVFPKFYNAIIGNTDFKNNDVYSSLFTLVERMIDADNKALLNHKSYADSIKGLLQGTAKYAIKPLNSRISKLLESLTTYHDKDFNLGEIIEKYRKEEEGQDKNDPLFLVKITAKVLQYVLTSSKARNALPTVLSYYGHYTSEHIFGGYGLVGRWINEIKGSDAYGRIIESFGGKARMIDKIAKDTMNMQHKLLIDSFKDEDRPNGLNEIEKALLTKILLKTDIQCLDLKASELKSILNSDKRLDEAIDKELEVIKAYSRNNGDFNFYINSSKLLARYLISGDMSSITALNAVDIARKSGTGKNMMIQRPSQELVKSLDKYSTLLALKYTSKEHKSIVSTFNEKGLDLFIDSHRTYVNNSKTEINTDTYAGRSKGYTETLFDNSHDIRIGFEEQQNLFDSKGFKPIPNSLVGNLGNKKLILYKDGFKEEHSRNGAAFMFTGYAKLGTSLYQFLDTEKEILDNTERSVREKAINYRAELEKNRRSKMKQLHSKVMSYNELHKLVKNYSNTFTIFDEFGNVAEYGLSMPTRLKKELGNTDDGITILSKMQSTLLRQQMSLPLNKDLFNVLVMMSERKQESILIPDDEDNNRWVSLSDSSISPFIRNIYKTTDQQFKKMLAKYKSDTGNDLIVREDLLLDIFGQSDISIASKIPRNHYILKHVIDFAERLTKYIATQYKTLIVIKTPIVLIQNIISNMMFAVMQGISPIRVISSYKEDLRLLQNYKDTKEKRDVLLIKKTVQSLTKSEDTELTILNQKLKANPLHELMEKGFMQNIVEDVDLVQIDNTSYFDSKLQKLKNKLPSKLQTVLDVVYMTENTATYQIMTKATTYSDFLARSLEYKVGIEKLNKQNLSKNEYEKNKNNLLHTIIENYINYDKPHSAAEQWLNDMGFMLFTKYFKRVQSVIHRFAIKNPINTALFLAANAATVDLSNIMQSSMWIKDMGTIVNNPLTFIPEISLSPYMR